MARAQASAKSEFQTQPPHLNTDRAQSTFAPSTLGETVAAIADRKLSTEFSQGLGRGIDATVEVGYGKGMPSRLVLPVVPGVSVPTGFPPCPGLRGQPCRTYEPAGNGG